MATGKRLIDYSGNTVQIGDVVYWRAVGFEQTFDLTGQIIDTFKIDDEIYLTVKGSDGIQRKKLTNNVQKMPNNEAMLWKLENL